MQLDKFVLLTQLILHRTFFEYEYKRQKIEIIHHIFGYIFRLKSFAIHTISFERMLWPLDTPTGGNVWMIEGEAFAFSIETKIDGRCESYLIIH